MYEDHKISKGLTRPYCTVPSRKDVVLLKVQ
jgi:hypothetical protein